MTEARCATPIGFAEAVDYWAGELSAADEGRIEAHAFGCVACERELAAAGALAGGVSAAVREGRIHAVITDDVLNRLAADGARIRMFTLDGPAVVPCAVWADDDLVVSRIRADFAGVAAVDIVTRQATGEEIGRLSDVPIRPGQREILNAFSAASLRALPETRVLVRVTAHAGGGERTLAEFTLEHAGAFGR
jgi:hypothetical protein